MKLFCMLQGLSGLLFIMKSPESNTVKESLIHI